MNACARLTADVLPCLSRWRDRDDIRVVVRDDLLWVFWSATAEEIGRHVLALPGAALARSRDGHWRRGTESLPIFDVPDPSEAVSLDRVLFPELIPRSLGFNSPLNPSDSRGRVERLGSPLTVSLVRDTTPRQTTALRVSLSTLSEWADVALSDEIEAVEAAISAAEVILMGRLPALTGDRFWGRRLLVPSGWRPEPDLAESLLSEALGLGNEYALFTTGGVEVIPARAFGPLTRAGVRLAARQGGRS